MRASLFKSAGSLAEDFPARHPRPCATVLSFGTSPRAAPARRRSRAVADFPCRSSRIAPGRSLPPRPRGRGVACRYRPVCHRSHASKPPRCPHRSPSKNLERAPRPSVCPLRHLTPDLARAPRPTDGRRTETAPSGAAAPGTPLAALTRRTRGTRDGGDGFAARDVVGSSSGR